MFRILVYTAGAMAARVLMLAPWRRPWAGVLVPVERRRYCQRAGEPAAAGELRRAVNAEGPDYTFTVYESSANNYCAVIAEGPIGARDADNIQSLLGL